MTQEEILDFNKRVAEFLGAELHIPKPWYYLPRYNEHYYFKDRHEPNRFVLKSMKFHSDWNWIHEVIEAIEKLDWEDNSVEFNRQLDNCLSLIIYSKKESVVEAINQFLIWYEQNK